MLGRIGSKAPQKLELCIPGNVIHRLPVTQLPFIVVAAVTAVAQQEKKTCSLTPVTRSIANQGILGTIVAGRAAFQWVQIMTSSTRLAVQAINS